MNHSESEAKAKKLIPGVKEFVKELIHHCMVMHPIEYKESDHFGMMSILFLSKQMEHMISIIILVEKGQGRDSEIIARSMYEGLVQIRWAQQDPNDRALRWRSYLWVSLWRKLREKQKNGKQINPTTQNQVNQELQQYGKQFYTARAKRQLEESNSLPDDPYRDNWFGKTLRQIANDVKGEPLYKGLYKPICQWVHWDPIALEKAIKTKGEETQYHSPSYISSYNSLAFGFQCLYETADIVNAHLKKGFDEKLNDLKDRYINFQENN